MTSRHELMSMFGALQWIFENLTSLTRDFTIIAIDFNVCYLNNRNKYRIIESSLTLGHSLTRVCLRLQSDSSVDKKFIFCSRFKTIYRINQTWPSLHGRH